VRSKTSTLYATLWVKQSMLSLACRDAGVKDCDYVAKGEMEEELWRDGTDHVIKVHGMKADDVTPQFKESHRPYIKRS
jgi:predicted small metal-binding protein